MVAGADKPHRAVKALSGFLLIQDSIPDGLSYRTQTSFPPSDVRRDFFMYSQPPFQQVAGTRVKAAFS